MLSPSFSGEGSRGRPGVSNSRDLSARVYWQAVNVTQQRRVRGVRPSDLVIGVVLIAALVGALSLGRQSPMVPPTPPPPPAWSVAGHDAGHTLHSLSYYTPVPISLLWWGRMPAIARDPVIDGYGGIYLSRPEGALLALDAHGNTNWCSAQQAITDTSCTGTLLPPPPQAPPTPVAPNALVGPDGHIYVVGASGVLRAYSPTSPKPLWHAWDNLDPDAGVVFGPDAATLYGVSRLPSASGVPRCAVVALRWPGRYVSGWHMTPIASRGLTPVSVAPDGTVLVAARSTRAGDAATLYALDSQGYQLWRLPLAPGEPSTVAVAGTSDGWAAWVAVNGASGSTVVVADQDGHALWRWRAPDRIDVANGGVALAHPFDPDPFDTGLGFVGTPRGVYALDLGHQRARLFFDTRRLGPALTPVTDVRNTVYVATSTGHIFDLWWQGNVRWHYATGRHIDYPPVLFPAAGLQNGAVLVLSTDRQGQTIAEALGAGGTPLATGTASACAAPDCPTPTPTVTPTSTFTASPTPSVTQTMPPTTTLTSSPTPSAAPSGSPAVTASVGATLTQTLALPGR